jgi:hypothetical protein
MRAGVERMNLVKHDQDVGAVRYIMARRPKALKAAKYLCDEYLVLNGRTNQTRITAGGFTACPAPLTCWWRDAAHRRPHPWVAPGGHLPKSVSGLGPGARKHVVSTSTGLIKSVTLDLVC